MPNSSLSVSFLLRPNWPFLHSFATLLAAASTHRALTHLFSGIDVSIKWPNDIMIGQLKVAGILAQRNLDGSVVVGIGINLFPQSQAPETATALSEYVQPDFDEVTAALLASMRSNWLSLQENADTDQLIDYIRSNCSTLGMRVRAELANSESIVGRAINITAQGHLVIHNETEHIVAAADLWHLRKH
jgi:BirA family biotin operon repressor/biotin-[acetyl-CoA-carboxylase] ligase